MSCIVLTVEELSDARALTRTLCERACQTNFAIRRYLRKMGYLKLVYPGERHGCELVPTETGLKLLFYARKGVSIGTPLPPSDILC